MATRPERGSDSMKRQRLQRRTPLRRGSAPSRSTPLRRPTPLERSRHSPRPRLNESRSRGGPASSAASPPRSTRPMRSRARSAVATTPTASWRCAGCTIAPTTAGGWTSCPMSAPSLLWTKRAPATSRSPRQLETGKPSKGPQIATRPTTASACSGPRRWAAVVPNVGNNPKVAGFESRPGYSQALG
jgi:hypothetical protein